MDRRLVDHLVNSELVSRGAMQRMILRATKRKTGVVEQLLADDGTDQEALAGELADYFGLDVVTERKFKVNETALKFISKKMADKHGVLPFAVSEETDHVTVAVYNPEAAQSVVDSLKTATGKEPTVQIAPKRWLEEAIRHYYFGETWAQAPEHSAMTREVADPEDLSDEALLEEESEEILLDEVVVPPKPGRLKATRDGSKPEPAAQESDEGAVALDRLERETNAGRKGRRSGSKKTKNGRRRRKSRPDSESDPHVEAALDDFDQFLDSSTGWGSGSRNKIPGWDDEDDAPAKQENPFAREPVVGPGWEKDRNGSSNFDLFDSDRFEPSDEDDLQAIIDEHEVLIERLRRELHQQREIISALVDALAENGVVSKRDIKRRMKRK